jgi:hypothetical protein
MSALVADFTGQRVGLPSERLLSLAEEISARAPGARVVETFNLTFAELLASPSRNFGGERPTLPLCGDDTNAKIIVARLVEECGLEPLAVGALRMARSLETLATTWVQMAVVVDLFPAAPLRFCAVKP